MSARTKRRKAHASGAGQAQAQQPAQAVPGYQPLPMPKWQWRTFPVFFAFALGGFIGLYTGIIAWSGNNTTQLVVFMFWAIMLGFGFSRITSRWMLSRSWGRRAATKKK